MVVIGDNNMKDLNYRIGALKRKFKMGKGDFEPGTLINKLKTQNAAAPVEVTEPSKEKVAIMGLV